MLTKLTNYILFFLLSFFLFFLRRGEQKKKRRRWGTWHQRSCCRGEKRECQIYKTLTFKLSKLKKNKTLSHKWKPKLRDQGRWKGRIQTGIRLHGHQALFFLRVLVLLLKIKIITMLNENSTMLNVHSFGLYWFHAAKATTCTRPKPFWYSLSHSRFISDKK